MITYVTIKLKMEHQASSDTREILEGIKEVLEQDNEETNPDDFGVVKYTVEKILVEVK